jgi:hypothetical protein
MQPEVVAVLTARKLAYAAHEAHGAADAAALQQPPAVCVTQLAAAAACSVDDLQLLQQYGCLPAAHGVYTSLMTWLQQQQQQQQQRQQQEGREEDSEPACLVEDGSQLQSAAAAAATFAPNLLAAVLKQQGGLPAVNLVSTQQ